MQNKYVLVSAMNTPVSGMLRCAHALGAAAQLALVILVSLALANSTTDEIIARSTVITIWDKPSFPSRVRVHDLFGQPRRLKPDKTIDALVGSLEALDAPCSTTACCAEYHTVSSMPTDVLISDCYDETDKRWSDPLRAHLNPPGYNVLVLVLLAPVVSFIHHASAVLFRRETSVVAKYVHQSHSLQFRRLTRVLQVQ
jgi:hypothetical protein